MVDDDTPGVDRRSFLRRTAITGAVGVGALGGAAGSAAAHATAVPPDRAETLLDAHADEVLAMLESDGVLGDRAELPTTVENDLAGVAAGREGAALLSLPDRPEELRVVSQVGAGTLKLVVQPGEGHAFALLDTGDGTLGYSVEQGRYDFEAQASCGCTGIKCGPYPSIGYYEECCDASGCELGDCVCL